MYTHTVKTKNNNYFFLSLLKAVSTVKKEKKKRKKKILDIFVLSFKTVCRFWSSNELTTIYTDNWYTFLYINVSERLPRSIIKLKKKFQQCSEQEWMRFTVRRGMGERQRKRERERVVMVTKVSLNLVRSWLQRKSHVDSERSKVTSNLPGQQISNRVFTAICMHAHSTRQCSVRARRSRQFYLGSGTAKKRETACDV